MFTKWRRLLLVVLLASMSAVVPSAVMAQTRSEITGTIKDSTGAVLPGVTVTLVSPDMVGGAQTSVTNARGVYRLSELPPGLYELTATLDGFQAVKRAALSVAFATTLTVDLTMPIGAVSETVIVTGASPVVDVKKAASTTKLDDAQLQNLPSLIRSTRANEIFTLAPGITSQGAALGGSRTANNFLIDGTSVSGGNLSTMGSTSVSFNWMQEVQVVGLGANAEYGDFTGTVSNMVLRSGSNRFSGLADYFTPRQNWVADNTSGLSDTLRARFKPMQVITQWDASAHVGGPIKRDKIFFFAGVSYYHGETLSAGALGGVPTDQRLPRVLAKLHWAVSPAIRVEGFVERERDHTNLGSNVSTMPDATNERQGPKTMWNQRLTWTVGSQTLVEIRNGGLVWDLSLYPKPPRTTTGPAPHRDTITGISFANSATSRFSGDFRNITSGSVTRWVENFLGMHHELKFGVEIEHLAVREERGYPAGIFYLDSGGKPNQATLWDGSVTDATVNRVSGYAQNTWSLTNTVTLLPGVRFAFNRGAVQDKGTVFKTNPVSPRLGVAWDINGDHKMLLRAQFGRFHEGLSSPLVEFMDTSRQSTKITVKVLGPGNFQELNRFVPSTSFGIDPNLAAAYMDQYFVGFERELFPDVSLVTQYIHRTYEETFAFVDTGSRYQATQAQDPGPDGKLGTADDGAFLEVYSLVNPGQAFRLLTNPADAYRRYDGLQVIAKKRYSHNWQLQLAYTYSKTRGTVNDIAGDNTASGTGTGQTGTFANPNAKINSDGPSVNDLTHQLSLQGTYRLPIWGGMSISGVYRHNTGTPLGRTATIRLSQGNETVRIEPRGTTRTDASDSIDLRLEKTFVLGAPTRTIGVYMDLFNTTNQGAATALIEASGATFGTPSGWTSPRTLQAGVRFVF